MRRIFLASAAFFACAAVDSASAADLPPAAPPPAYAPVKAPVPVWSWSGCYVGVNGGGTRAQNRADLSPGGNYLNAPGTLPPPNLAGSGDFPADIAALSHSYDMASNGWEAGGQVGCNVQWGMAVFGVEGDWQWSNASTSADATFAGISPVGQNGGFFIPAHTEHVDVTQRWFATARARAGFTPWERVLVYGTGGIAWANFQSNTAVVFATSPPFPLVPYNGATHIGSASTNQIGWVAGGGIEWALTNNWSVKAEYLYLRFDGFNYSSPLTAAVSPFAPGYAWNTSISLREQVLRLGVNYKFDWGPVVARY